MNTVGGMCVGAITGAAIMGAAWIASEWFIPVEHDPAKLLQLQKECFAVNSERLTTTYCDNYAERYSRISPKN